MNRDDLAGSRLNVMQQPLQTFLRLTPCGKAAHVQPHSSYVNNCHVVF